MIKITIDYEQAESIVIESLIKDYEDLANCSSTLTEDIRDNKKMMIALRKVLNYYGVEVN